MSRSEKGKINRGELSSTLVPEHDKVILVVPGGSENDFLEALKSIDLSMSSNV